MITRKEIDRRLKASEGLYTNAVEQMLDEEAAKYQALVDAVTHARQIQNEPPDVTKALDALSGIFKAHEPFLPPPLLSEKLDTLADAPDNPIRMHTELHQLADEARELEKAEVK